MSGEPDRPRLLTTKEAAAEMRTTAGYVRELINAGKLKHLRRGDRGNYLIEMSEIDRYLKRSSLKPRVRSKECGLRQALREVVRPGLGRPGVPDDL